jgi:capping protein (actin filament) muscle Z-line, alpha
MTSSVGMTSSFIQNAPPGELADVVKDIKTLTSDDDPTHLAKLKPAFEQYNEDQMVAVKLPGSSGDHVCLPLRRDYQNCSAAEKT